jgi:hypothetical protein
MADQMTTEDVQISVGAAVARERLETTNKSSASWFFFVAGLSIVNSIIVLAGSDWNFIVGLGATQVIDGIVAAATEDAAGAAVWVVTAIALVINVLIAGVYVVLGIFARKRHSWAYITGMVFYGLDGLLFVFFAAWLNVAFHAFVLFSLFGGLKACRELAGLKEMKN